MSMGRSRLRTNWKLPAANVQDGAIGFSALGGNLGAALIRGSGVLAGSVGTNLPGAGIVVISVGGSVSGYGFAQSSAGIPDGASGWQYWDSAVGILSQFYGSGLFGAGYAVLPILLWDRGMGGGSTSYSVMLFLWSVALSGSISKIKLVAQSMVASWASAVPTLLDGGSAVFRWIGFIVSAP